MRARASQLNLLAALVLVISCGSESSPGSFGGPTPHITSVSDSDPAGTSSLSTSGDLSSGPTPEGESASETSSMGTPRLDVGASADLGDDKPLGCGGKIDFLFLISRDHFMDDPPQDKPWLGAPQERLLNAFPAFFQTIEAKFAAFDYHIMVVDGDAHWGWSLCSEDCADPFCAEIEGYPCDSFDQVTKCDRTMGAGLVFNAGMEAENKPCDIPDGRRYLISGDPSPEETFACLAHVGTGGHDRLNEALMATMSPALNGPGGCNEGFIRDDALLMLTFINGSGDLDSNGDVWDWLKSVRLAKHEELDAVVAFAITKSVDLADCDTGKPDLDRTCELVRKFPYHDHENLWTEDWGPGFDRATDLLVAACADFIPQ